MRTALLGIIGLVGVVTLLASADGLAVASGAHIQEQAPTNKPFSYRGISFAWEASLATGVTGKTLAEGYGGTSFDTPYASRGTFLLAKAPQHAIISFQGFRTTGILDPAIYIYPVRANYRSLDPGSREDLWRMPVDRLKEILAGRPNLRTIATNGMPFLPPINTARLAIAKQDYMSFRNGSGVRYLAQITQSVGPITKENTVYTFQGLTADGRYYVAAIFPAFLASPPQVPPMSSITPEQVDTYNLRVRNELDQASGTGYLPNLDSIDAIVRSLNVQPSAIPSEPPPTSSQLPGLPNTGAPGRQVDAFIAALLAAICAIVAAGLAMRKR